ncbi:MAG: hypothetical protein JRF69_06735 [Deltaproteobacteria bacterium]|nr:hypothetical protein [Deltaproteobacteria bacterium]
MESWSNGVLEKNERRTAFIIQHSSSAVVAVGYYGEVGYSNTPELVCRLGPEA